MGEVSHPGSCNHKLHGLAPHWALRVDCSAYGRYGPHCYEYVQTAAQEVAEQLDLAP